MIIAIICVAAVVLALGCLSVLLGGLSRRLRDLDTQLTTAREQLAELGELGEALTPG